MYDSSKQSVADSLETEEKLLPYMPYLLQDMWELGCAIEQILQVIGTLSLPPESSKILDLGCGKGAVSVQAASKYGFTVTGIDAMPEFLDIAREKSSEYNVSDLCTFIEQDILTYVQDTHNFDIVLLASLGGVFGTNVDTVEKMRTQVKTDGYIIIDDGYLKTGNVLNRKGYGHYRNYKDTVGELTTFKDQIVAEISTTEVSNQINFDYLAVIEKRGRELIEQHPELKKDISNYIDLQREECEVLERDLEGMIWVIKKTVTY